MKVFVTLAFLATLGLLAEADYRHWKSRDIVMPVNPKYTAQEWRDTYASQVEIPKQPGVVKDAQPQPEFAGKVHVNDDHHRITNGYTASRGQFPWQVALIIDSSTFCGGSLIAQQYVLTAAHCAGSSYQVILGANRVDSPESNSVTVSSRNSIVHSNYDPNTINNDIALIILSQPVQYTNYISPISLPSSNIGNLEGETVRASGWGKTSDGSNGISASLQFADLVVTSNTECAEAFGSAITSTKLCVSTYSGQSTCNGDSGGPLVIQENNGYTLVGIVSFGSSYGCEQGYPAVFTRVTSYLDWIQYYTGTYVE